MDFETFLNALVKVAELLFHEVVDDSGAALKALLEHHLMGLYHKIASTNQVAIE